MSNFKLYILLLFSFISACYNSKTSEGTDKILIICTTNIIADGVKNIVDSSFEVVALMGAGVDPHLYKTSLNDLKKLKQADVIFYNGLNLEGKMGESLKKFKQQKPVFAVGDGVDSQKLRKLSKNTFDPHIWFDIQLWMMTIDYASKTLQTLYPDKKEIFNEYTKKYLKKLSALDSLVKIQIASITKQQRLIITSHDAFSYFGHAYDIEVKGLQGISTLDEFGLKDIIDIIDLIIQRQIKAVFVETSVSSKSIEAVVVGCKEKQYNLNIGGKLFSDALGDSNSPEGTYVGMMQSNVKVIVEALTN